jgi:hypothetical protein
MSEDSNQARLALRSIWDAQESSLEELDEECNPNKICKNMKEVTFEGFSEQGIDLKTAWRQTLEREGKLAGPGSTIKDLVFGNDQK